MRPFSYNNLYNIYLEFITALLLKKYNIFLHANEFTGFLINEYTDLLYRKAKDGLRSSYINR